MAIIVIIAIFVSDNNRLLDFEYRPSLDLEQESNLQEARLRNLYLYQNYS